MTALGVPHFAGRPSTLLLQIIVPTLAGGAGAGAAATGLGGGGEGAWGVGEQAPITRASPAEIRRAGRLNMRDSEGPGATLVRPGPLGQASSRGTSKSNMGRKIC